MTSVGAKLYYDADGVSTYTQLTGIISMSGPDQTVEMKDQTDLDSTSGWKEYCAGFKDGGTLTAVIHVVKAMINTIHGTLFGTNYYWEVRFPLQTGESTASKFGFQGTLNGCSTEIPADDTVTCQITIKVNGPVTWTSGS
jgi:hypothetical protein